MPSFTPVLRLSKTNAEGTAPLYIRISDRGGSRFVSLGKRVQPRHWDADKARVLGRHPDYKLLNRLIEERVEKLRAATFRAEFDGPAPTADQLQQVYRETYSPPKTPEPEQPDGEEACYFEFADTVVVELDRRGQIRTHNRYKSNIKKFRAFAGPTLPFSALTPRLLRDYETHLVEHYGNATNTVATNFRTIRAVLYRAIKEGLADQGANPFFHVKLKQTRSDKTKLSYEQICAVEDLQLPSGSLLACARDAFLFSFYCAGIRFGDFASLRGSDFSFEGDRLRLSYVMDKTGHRRSLTVPRVAAALFDLYGQAGSDEFAFPPLRGYRLTSARTRINAISSQNAVVNKALKRIAELAEIDAPVTFHVSRHSFADYARRKGWSVYDIAKMLGHGSIKTTETYLASLDGSLERDADDLFDRREAAPPI